MSDGAFYGYILLLVVSGLTLSVLAACGFGQSIAMRVLDGLFGVVFLAYAFYLYFLFDGGQVTILFYAFVVPILAVVKVLRAWREQQAVRALTRYAQPAPAQPGHPAGAGQPAQAEPVPAHGAPGMPSPIQVAHSGEVVAQVPPGAAYWAPVLTRTIGEPLQTSPYGRHTPGQPIGHPCAPGETAPTAAVVLEQAPSLP
jgi:hypothetical protein